MSYVAQWFSCGGWNWFWNAVSTCKERKVASGPLSARDVGMDDDVICTKQTSDWTLGRQFGALFHSYQPATGSHIGRSCTVFMYRSCFQWMIARTQSLFVLGVLVSWCVFCIVCICFSFLVLLGHAVLRIVRLGNSSRQNDFVYFWFPKVRPNYKERKNNPFVDLLKSLLKEIARESRACQVYNFFGMLCHCWHFLIQTRLNGSMISQPVPPESWNFETIFFFHFRRTSSTLLLRLVFDPYDKFLGIVRFHVWINCTVSRF